jgi:hypothetical protein
MEVYGGGKEEETVLAGDVGREFDAQLDQVTWTGERGGGYGGRESSSPTSILRSRRTAR